ncbi:MAG: hypothetical protein JW971_04560, partial [Synergistales bacterium]|nr:hypothetical protein [Synergistales bacterium]
MNKLPLNRGFKEMQSFPLMEALLGRRSRRFFMGAEIPDGVFAYRSNHESLPLSELEKMLVVAACGGNTTWNNLIYRAAHYAPHISNYAASAGGRLFPSAAGFHTSQTFFTDDDGLYLLELRDAPAFEERLEDGSWDLEAFLENTRKHVRKIHDGRLRIPSEIPFIEAHNTWVVNRPSTLLVIPVGDLSQHVLLNLCYMLQNNLVLYDDIHKCPIPGIEEFRDMVDISNVWPLTFVEQWSMSELTVELGTSCYAGALMLQAMGLGGWMFNGVDPFIMMGASGDPEAPGLGFRYDTDDRWPYPNPTGLEGVMEGY